MQWMVSDKTRILEAFVTKPVGGYNSLYMHNAALGIADDLLQEPINMMNRGLLIKIYRYHRRPDKLMEV